MEEKTFEQLRQMLRVRIDKVEEQGEELVIYVPKEDVARAIGAGGCVVHAAELILKRKLRIKESAG